RLGIDERHGQGADGVLEVNWLEPGTGILVVIPAAPARSGYACPVRALFFFRLRQTDNPEIGIFPVGVDRLESSSEQLSRRSLVRFFDVDLNIVRNACAAAHPTSPIARTDLEDRE